MHCQRVHDQFLDYQEGTLDPAAAAELRAHLASCPACQREWSALQEITRKLDQLPEPEPTGRLREQFYAMLETHQREADAPSPFALARSRLDRLCEALLPSRPALQAAFALALLAGGIVGGARFLAPAPAPAPAADPAAREELAALRAQVDGMGRLVTYSLLQQKSTSERLRSVLATLDLPSPDRQVLTDLVGALAFDPSVNVRLSALEALAPHAADEVVRAGLLAALPRESAPLVQVAMIDLLARVREVEAAPVLEQLSRDDRADVHVRQAAKRALATLRTPSPTDDKPNARTAEPAVPGQTA